MNEKLIKYFTGEMSSSEMREFEKVISESPSLKKEAAEYRELFSDIEETRKPEVDESYFINLVPRFRARREQSKEKKYHPAFSFATAVLAVIVVLLFIPNSNNVIKKGSPALNYSTTEISDYLTTNSDQSILTNLPADVEANYDSLLDGMIIEELNSNNQNLAGSEFVDKLDYNTLLQSVNQNDASVIYEQLKNKKIF
jgi:hypothetical protein